MLVDTDVLFFMQQGKRTCATLPYNSKSFRTGDPPPYAVLNLLVFETLSTTTHARPGNWQAATVLKQATVGAVLRHTEIKVA